MALKHMFAGAAGVKDFFTGAFSKNYSKVTDRSAKWLDTTKQQEQRLVNAHQFKNRLEQNTNLSPMETKAFQKGYNMQDSIRETLKDGANMIGAASSAIGGTFGFGVGKAAVATAKGTAVVAGGTALAIGAGAVGTAMVGGKVAAGVAKGTAAGAKRAAASGNRAIRSDSAKQFGQDAKDGTRSLYEFTGTKTFHALTAASVVGLAGTTYEEGKTDAARSHKMQQVASNISVSSDGGGAFLRNIASPEVDDMGATGELVFALHSLRNGG